MKHMLVCAALAIGVAVAMPGAASAWHGGGGFHGGGFHGGGFHGFPGGGFRGFHGGFRGVGIGFYPGYYSGYYDPCWRWVRWPYWHRAYVCY
jgi:hypothetical protein